jgi:PAS domain S-box-containing protein
MSKLLGYNAEQLKGLSYEDFLDREHIQKYRQSIEKPGYNPHSYLEVTLVGASGDRVQALANSTALSATQTRESLRFSFFTDITEIRKMERLHEDVQRIVRHDLKSPLNGIIGLASLLQEDTEQENQREFLQEIINSGNKMLHMINHSLELFKMEEGSYKLHPEQFNLNIVLANLERETSSLRKGKDLQVNYYLNGQELDWEKTHLITGEQRNLESMLANLLTNALEASPQGETVEVRISRNQDHVIEIHNQGTIPEEIRDKFFERYVTWGKNHGTGLGAYSARLIARAHGGDITFQSSEQKGTTLKVHLPELA